MELNLFLLHFAILLFALTFAYFWSVRTLRLKASFNLYRIRDRFVFLVASDLLQEESEVFKHYYNRVNALLQTAPNVGIDDILQAVFHEFKNSKDFVSTMEKVKLRVKKLQESPEMKNPDVREAVAEFYKAVQMMVLSHSSIVRVTYIVSRKLSKRLLSRFPQGKVRRGLCTVEFAEFEEKAFAV